MMRAGPVLREAMPANGSTITSWVSAPVWGTSRATRAGTVDGVVKICIIALPGHGYPFRHEYPFDGARPEVPGRMPRLIITGPIMPPMSVSVTPTTDPDSGARSCGCALAVMWLCRRRSGQLLNLGPSRSGCIRPLPAPASRSPFPRWHTTASVDI